MKDVVVAGAGLAGLTVARLLAERGARVTVLEASSRAGGKAGADLEDGIWREHGYHIFPPWYVNTRPLVEELGGKLIDFDGWHYLEENRPGKPTAAPIPQSWASLKQLLGANFFPLREMFLYGYLAIDTLAEPMKAAGLLDQVSRIGLMRSRWYVTDSMPLFEQENLLKASAISAHDMSAMTVKIVLSNWTRSISPFLSILAGDLQSVFIDPYLAVVRAAGAEVRLSERAIRAETRAGRVSALLTRLPDGTERRYTGDAFVFTTPLEVTRKLIGGDLQAIDPHLGNFERLHNAPMAALHLDLDHRLSWSPREHVVLRGARYGLTFIDLVHHWPGMTNSSLSFIASDFLPLRDLPAGEQYDALLKEVIRYLNIRPEQIVRYSLKPNVDAPLFINTVGAWPNRPLPRSQQVPNLYFAGDWARNQVDLASMEGALCSAIDTARILADDFNLAPVPPPIRAKTYPQALFRALKYALLPGIVPLWVYAKLSNSLSR